MDEERDVLQLLAVFQQKAAEFEREMEALGIKVEISASFGIWTSGVEKVDIPGRKVNA